MTWKCAAVDEVEARISKLRQMNAMDDAEAMCNLHIKIYEASLGIDAPETLTLLHRLGDILHERQSLNEAIEVTKRAILGREKKLGLWHVDTLKSIANLGNILWDLGKHPESEAALRRAHEGFASTLGPEHYYALKSIKNLVLFLKSHGRIQECCTLLEKDLMQRTSLAEEKFPLLHTNRVDVTSQQ